MAQICNNSSNEYLNYKCHFKLKDYFSGMKISKDIEDNLKIFLQPKIDNKRYSEKKKQVFNELYQYLGGDGIFYSQDPTECCKYINYWLNTSVRELLPDLYDNESFKIFRYIVDFYNKNKNQSKNKRCTSDIYYIEPDEFRKMDILYNLYNYYGKLTVENRGYYYEPCDYLINMYNIYKDALNSDDKKDKNFVSRLKAFKDLIDKVLPEHNDCPSYIQFKEPESIEETKVIEPEHHTTTHDQELSPPSKQDSPPPKPESSSPLVLQPVPSEFQAEHIRETFNSSERNQPLRMESEETNSELSQTTYKGNSERHTLKPGSYHSGELIYPHTLGNPSYSENEVLKKLGRQHSEDGFLDKIQGAFTGIVQSVDPAPVLGVSGGMGALFLLFKYTPVGSFFGGRRRRFRQIPRSFNGQFLGAFPDFQDYEGGHIGYGPMNMNPLAE
ncbi:Plasmodium vivax Vir protein, putative [Plasmodium vivax]|uniref:Vir protein, putative n=1 Tax=Plasmodium vivax TaxID=5855 RepID=A0A1G4E3S5_PLAVI|nr:Plasmodium vivax Vir protein, putative [Plasmodium vivax]